MARPADSPTLPRGARSGYSEESAVVGTVQSYALATGLLFIALYRGYLTGTNALLFGSFLGITTGQVDEMTALAKKFGLGRKGRAGRKMAGQKARRT